MLVVGCDVLNTVNTSNIGYLFGSWSVFALFAGLMCSAIGILDSGRTKSLSLSGLMAVLAAVLGMGVLPMSYGYSGPLSSSDREVPRYGICFAFLIAFMFGFGFALDALFAKHVRRRAVAGLVVLLYSIAASWLTYCFLSPK